MNWPGPSFPDQTNKQYKNPQKQRQVPPSSNSPFAETNRKHNLLPHSSFILLEIVRPNPEKYTPPSPNPVLYIFFIFFFPFIKGEKEKEKMSLFCFEEGKKMERKSRLFGKQQKGGSISSSSSHVLSRSFTMHTKPTEAYPANLPATLDRSGSTRSRNSGFYAPFSSLRSKVNKFRSFFDSSKSKSSSSFKESHHHRPSKLGPARSLSSPTYPSIHLSGSENRIVVYFTSLHGIRRTFEDCYAVRMIFRGFRIWVDERDVSMDLEYKKELQAVLGERNVSLPQVFIGGAYVGGADALKQLHDTGELAKLLERFPRRAPGFMCHGCGDMRFVPCPNCCGSRKIFDEDDEGCVVPRRCAQCNENGLVRCPGCCS